jgi:hypothetical protein
MQSQLPQGFLNEITNLARGGQYAEALHLLELSIALVKSVEIRAAFERQGRDILQQFLPEEESQKPPSTVEEVQKLLAEVIAIPVRTALGRPVSLATGKPSDSSHKASTKKKQIRKPSISGRQQAMLKNFLLYCSQNRALNERLKNQPVQDAVDKFLFVFSYKTKFTASPEITKTKQKLAKILSDTPIKDIRGHQTDIKNYLGQIGRKLHSLDLIGAELEAHGPLDRHFSAIGNLAKKFPFINPYYDESLELWQKQVASEYTALQSKAGLEAACKEIEDILEACNEINYSLVAIRKCLDKFNPQEADKLLPAEIYHLNSVAKFADILPPIDLPLIQESRAQAKEAQVLLDKMNVLFQVIKPRESGDVVHHVEGKMRHYMGKSDYPEIRGTKDLVDTYIRYRNTRHVSLINMQDNTPQTIEILEEGYTQGPTRFEDAFYADDYTLEFSKIINPDKKETLQRLLGFKTDSELAQEMKFRYQKCLHDVITTNAARLKQIGYTESSVEILLYSIANYIDTLFWGKLLPRPPVEFGKPSQAEQLKIAAQTMKCSELVATLLTKAFELLETDLNKLAQTEGVRYCQEILPPWIEGTTPAWLKTFTDTFCVKKEPQYQNKFILLS